MQPKQRDFFDVKSIYDLDQSMPKDFIFLLLHLINYPDTSSQIFAGERIPKLKFERIKTKNFADFLFLLEQEVGLKITIAGEKKLLTQIDVSDQAVKNIESIIDAYLKKFTKNKLRPISEGCYSFEKQMDYFLAAIQKKLDAGFTETLIFTDSEVESGYNFFECLLILEQQKYLTIENIYNCQDKNVTEYYKIKVTINKRKFQIPVKEKVFPNPYCIEEKGVGYLKYNKNSKKIKISRATSRPYKLLRCLTEPFGVAKPINLVYEALVNKKDATINNPYLALNIKIRKIEFTIKELQRIPEYSKNLKIHIDKERKIVWLERID